MTSKRASGARGGGVSGASSPLFASAFQSQARKVHWGKRARARSVQRGSLSMPTTRTAASNRA